MIIIYLLSISRDLSATEDCGTVKIAGLLVIELNFKLINSITTNLYYYDLNKSGINYGFY